jgi:hypothetical protein
MTKVYDILVINDKTNKQILMGMQPMTHKECMTVISKMVNYPTTRKMPYLLTSEN